MRPETEKCQGPTPCGEASASFLKKRSKKLLIPAGLATVRAKCFSEQKFFARFFLKKRCFLCLPILLLLPGLRAYTSA
jgi:hypothetical protein